MAYRYSKGEIRELTLAQMDLLVPERQRDGFHTFLTIGQGAEDLELGVFFHTDFVENATFTTLFTYGLHDTFKIDSTEPHRLHLSRKGDVNGTYIELGFSDQYTLGKKNGSSSPIIPHEMPDIETPVQGTHVLQYKRTLTGIEVRLDGVLLAPDNFFSHPQVEEFQAFIEKKSKSGIAFLFYETHFTLDNVTAAYGKTSSIPDDFGHFIEPAKFSTGGYAQWSGQWPENTDFIVRYEGKEVARLKVPPTGVLEAILKVYETGLLLKDANPAPGAQLVSTRFPGSGPLLMKFLTCTHPTSFKGLIFVSDPPRWRWFQAFTALRL